VRNNLTYMEWGAEESHGGFPFSPGQPFEIIILVDHNAFKIAVNGYHFVEFGHRQPPRKISHLTIDGDVSIQGIIYESHNPAASGSSAGPPQPTPVNPLPPYPSAGPSSAMPPYPVAGAAGYTPYPQTGPSTSYPTAGPSSSAYPTASGYGQQAMYPPPANYPPAYPTQQPYNPSYPTQPGYDVSGYPTAAGYPVNTYPGGFPHQQQKAPGVLGGLGSGLFGSKTNPKGGMGLGGYAGIAAGVGAAALGASMLSHAVPVRSLSKHSCTFEPKVLDFNLFFVFLCRN
jgi:hypothetical protein